MLCTVEPALMPRMLTAVSSTTSPTAMLFCVHSSSGTIEESAAAKATASAAMEPELPSVKFAKPHMKASRSP